MDDVAGALEVEIYGHDAEKVAKAALEEFGLVSSRSSQRDKNHAQPQVLASL